MSAGDDGVNEEVCAYRLSIILVERGGRVIG